MIYCTLHYKLFIFECFLNIKVCNKGLKKKFHKPCQKTLAVCVNFACEWYQTQHFKRRLNCLTNWNIKADVHFKLFNEHIFVLFSLVVDLCHKIFVNAGFVELSEKADWGDNNLKQNGKVSMAKIVIVVTWQYMICSDICRWKEWLRECRN